MKMSVTDNEVIPVVSLILSFIGVWIVCTVIIPRYSVKIQMCELTSEEAVNTVVDSQ